MSGIQIKILDNLISLQIIIDFGPSIWDRNSRLSKVFFDLKSCSPIDYNEKKFSHFSNLFRFPGKVNEQKYYSNVVSIVKVTQRRDVLYIVIRKRESIDQIIPLSLSFHHYYHSHPNDEKLINVKTFVYCDSKKRIFIMQFIII